MTYPHNRNRLESYPPRHAQSTSADPSELGRRCLRDATHPGIWRPQQQPSDAPHARRHARPCGGRPARCGEEEQRRHSALRPEGHVRFFATTTQHHLSQSACRTAIPEGTGRTPPRELRCSCRVARDRGAATPASGPAATSIAWHAILMTKKRSPRSECAKAQSDAALGALPCAGARGAARVVARVHRTSPHGPHATRARPGRWCP